MKILIVTDNRFWRAQLGSHKRIKSFCDHLASNEHTVHVLFKGYAYSEDIEPLKAARKEYAIEVTESSINTRKGVSLDCSRWAGVLVRRLQRGVVSLLRIRARHPGVIMGFRNRRLQRSEPKLHHFKDEELLARFRSYVNAFQPNAIVIEYVRLAYLLRDGRDAIPSECLTMIDTHDVQHERQARFHERGERHDIDITPAEEAEALSLADVCIAIQPADAEKLRALLPGRRVIVVGYPNEIVHGLDSEIRKVTRLGFLGSSMAPNVHAARRLIFEVFQPISRMHASIELHIYGGVCSELSSRPLPSGVSLHGFVEDVSRAYRDVDIVVNPIDFGGGLKIKNVEALCYGKPLITTSVGAEGIESGTNVSFRLADSNDEMIDALDELIRYADKRALLSRSAYAYAETHFSKASCYRALDDLLRSWSQDALQGRGVTT